MNYIKTVSYTHLLFVCACKNSALSEISLSLLALLREDVALVSLMSSYLAGTCNLESFHSPSVGFHLSHCVCPPDFECSRLLPPGNPGPLPPPAAESSAAVLIIFRC